MHRSRSLDDRTATTHDGIPITTVARTLLDAATVARGPRLTRSDLEARVLRLVRDAGLPELQVNVVLSAPTTHASSRPAVAGARRDRRGGRVRKPPHPDRVRTGSRPRRRVAAAGFRVPRFTWRTDDATVVRRLRAVL